MPRCIWSWDSDSTNNLLAWNKLVYRGGVPLFRLLQQSRQEKHDLLMRVGVEEIFNRGNINILIGLQWGEGDYSYLYFLIVSKELHYFVRFHPGMTIIEKQQVADICDNLIQQGYLIDYEKCSNILLEFLLPYMNLCFTLTSTLISDCARYGVTSFSWNSECKNMYKDVYKCGLLKIVDLEHLTSEAVLWINNHEVKRVCSNEYEPVDKLFCLIDKYRDMLHAETQLNICK